MTYYYIRESLIIYRIPIGDTAVGLPKLLLFCIPFFFYTRVPVNNACHAPRAARVRTALQFWVKPHIYHQSHPETLL